MGRISSKINLAALKNAVIVKLGKNEDVECIVIPIAQNKLFKSDKGAIYLDLVGFETPADRRKGKDTHLVKQSFSKEVRDVMSEAEAKAMPILGNHIDWDLVSDDNNAGQTREYTAPTASSADDLPF